MTWQDRAACNGMDVDLFFAYPTSTVTARAIAVCRTCPVIDECRDDVESRPLYQRHGVWGGRVYGGGEAITLRPVGPAAAPSSLKPRARVEIEHPDFTGEQMRAAVAAYRNHQRGGPPLQRGQQAAYRAYHAALARRRRAAAADDARDEPAAAVS